MSNRERRRLAVRRLRLAVAALAALARAAAAQPITDNDYAVDLTVGPVMGSARIVGNAGAEVAIAQGEDGIGFNPAAVAHRTAYSRGTWDWDAGLSLLGTRGGDDIDNNGIPDSESDLSAVASFGGLLQVERLGFGLHATLFGYRLRDEDEREVKLEASMYRVAVGWAFLRDQLIAAGAVRVVQIELRDAGGDKLFEPITAAAPDAGVLWRPRAWPVRAGAVFGGKVQADQTLPEPEQGEGCVRVGDLCLPARVTAAWFASLGAAWRVFGPGEFNPAAVWDENVPPPPPGRYALISLQADVIGPNGGDEDANALQSILRRERQRAGRETAVAPHAAVESEIVAFRLRARGGFYFEPSRYDDADGRAHGTAGLDLRVFGFDLLGHHEVRLSGAIDAAPRYLNAGVSLGFWH